jgi:cation:H+ antiporter
VVGRRRAGDEREQWITGGWRPKAWTTARLSCGVAKRRRLSRESWEVSELVQYIEQLGPWAPLGFLALFALASALTIWRLNAMTEYGFQGTALGTLVMPFCSGLGNLLFVFIVAERGSNPQEVFTNALVNNTTNLTLLIGLPALLWGLQVLPGAGGKKGEGKKPGGAKSAGKAQEGELNRLSLLLTILAVFFFTGAVWALAQDGTLDFGDGLVLTGLFAFWQLIHVFEVLKNNVRQKQSPNPVRLLFDLALLGVGAWLLYVSIDWLVGWTEKHPVAWLGSSSLGWLSGWLMVVPNALLALYYGWKRRPDIVFSSQVGDGHICIPLCLGLFALIRPIPVPLFFQDAAIVIGGAALVHFVCVATLGRLPRFMGAVMIAAYGWFLYAGLGK